ncbi:phytochrome-like protein cph2 [bacterium BMS3Bbin10]|nr:phytochrome-like protein cph2 [bacterium BMS3Bbin10]
MSFESFTSRLRASMGAAVDWRAHRAALLALLTLLIFGLAPAFALEPILIDPDTDRIDVTAKGELYEGRGDKLQIETVPGADGIVGRMAVQATTTGTNPSWIVFALKNGTEKPIVRWLTAQRYTLVGSSVFWPDLDSGRVAAVTPSLGFLPKRIANDQADIFSLTIEPGAVITFIVEMSSLQVPRLNLWKPEAYERQLKDRMLFNGILLGIVGLTAIFLTAVFAANHKSIFPAAALVAWAALALFCVDFGFWNKLFKLSAEDNAVYRAASEAAFVASLVVFLYSFLRVRLWHNWIKLAFGAWICAQVALIGLTLIDPRLASGLARVSLVGVGAIGALLITYLALRGQERAMSLVPTWMLLLVWIFGASLVVLGQLSGEIIVSSLLAGLVLLIVLLGFTVTQYAFRGGTPFHGGPPGQMQLSTLALEGSGTAIWQWNMRRGDLSVGVEVEEALSLPEGMLEGSLEEWLRHVHPADRDRFRLLLWSLQEKGGGELNTDFRMQRADGSYLWFELRAHTVESPVSDSAQRCVGLMRDISGQKRTSERLLHDAVHDSLTGLPNRELFLDRLSGAVMRAEESNGNRPTVLFIDIDRFKNVNKSLGLVVGDSMLLTLARRLSRHLNPQDTMARIGGDQFAVLIVSDSEPQHIALLSERIRRSLRSPMRISGKEIILTGSIGIAVYDGKQETHQDLLKEAEIAMFRAKRSGSDRVDIFKASMRGSEEGRLPLESELRRAIERKQIKVLYQPITNLEANTLSGFEALVRWDHPKRGRLSPDDFVPIAEETGLISELGSYVLDQALKQAVRWQKALPRAQSPIFVSVNVSSSQLFRRDLLQQIRSILSRDAVPKGTLWLEVTESMVMENPEQAIEIMKLLKELGAGLSLDDFGTGFSSLNYLHRFPVDTIKVDKSFIRDAEREGATPVILRSIVAMSHELGKKVVAEGVESAANADFLRSIGCEFAQGFYFGEPMSDRGAMSLVSTLAKAQKKQNSRRARRAPAKVPAKPAAPAPVAREGAGARRAAAAPLPAPGAPTPRQA